MLASRVGDPATGSLRLENEAGAVIEQFARSKAVEVAYLVVPAAI
jgi:hypothetical protein